MALTQISTKGIKDGTITGSDLATNVDLVDNQKIRFGTGNDLQIYHDGSNSYIKENGTGGLYQQTNGNGIFLQKTDGENMANFVTDGAVELYHDNSKKFETLSTGIQVTGNVTPTGYMKLVDNMQIYFGTGNDLEIFHDTNNSILKNNNGFLLLKSNNGINLSDASDTDNYLKCIKDGAVELYHDGTKTLETTSTGAKTSLANPVFEIEGTGNSGDAVLFLNAGANHWLVRADNSTSAGTFSIKSGTPSSSTHRLLINSSGNVGIGTSSITANTNYNTLQIQGQSGSGGAIIRMQTTDGSTMKAMIIGDTAGLELRTETDDPISFSTNNSFRRGIASNGQGSHNYTTDCNPKEIYEWSNNKTGMSFRSANTERGNIFFFDSGVQFNTGSDYRLKENVTTISDGITRIKQLKPYRFNWIIDESNTPVDGFLAHEVSSIVPEAVNGTKDAVATQEDVDSGRSQKIGDPIHQMIDHSKLVPLLAAGLKEAISKIEILETEVAALKAS